MTANLILIGIISQIVVLVFGLLVWRVGAGPGPGESGTGERLRPQRDIDQCVQLLAEVRQFLVDHQQTLSASQMLATAMPTEEEVARQRRVGQIVSGALEERVDALGTILQPYDDLYAQQRKRIRDYAAQTRELDEVMAQIEANAAEDPQVLLNAIRDLLAENADLRSTVAQCRRRMADLIARTIQLDRDVRIDPLTQLPNRRAWSEDALSLQPHGDMYIAILDLDRFKTINDQHGHAAGDAILKMIASIFRENSYPKLYRMGGDEFLMLFIERGPEAAVRLVEEIRGKVECSRVVQGDLRLSVTLSCGIAQAEEGESVETVVRRADATLYRAKRAGRNSVQLDELATAS